MAISGGLKKLSRAVERRKQNERVNDFNPLDKVICPKCNKYVWNIKRDPVTKKINYIHLGPNPNKTWLKSPTNIHLRHFTKCEID